MIKLGKKLIATFSILLLSTAALTGCGKEEVEEAPPVYELTALDSSQLEEGKLYVKDGDSFYECPIGTVLTQQEYEKWHEMEPYYTEISDDNMENLFKAIMFGQDDALIPTLYKDQQLIYVTSITPPSFRWDRYMDDGYTFGAIGMYANTTNKCTLTMDALVLLEGSSMRTSLVNAGLGAGDEIVINKVQNTPINIANLSTCGSIKGIDKNKAYKLEVYKGSDFYPLTDVIADTHVFHTFESFETLDYEYIQTDYVAITVPEDFQSGYYKINDLGLFRYVDGSATDGMDDVEFNDPYWIYLQEADEYIKYTDLKQEGEDTPVTPGNSSDVDYTSKTFIDCSNKSVVFTISYKDAMAQTLDGKLSAISDEIVGFPSAKLISPNGKEYVFAIDQSKKTLVCEVQTPISGEWTTTISNMSQRKFDISTSFTSGHSDTLFHEGSEPQNMTYYLSSHMDNAAFIITWENASRQATIEITAPDGTGYSKEIDSTIVYDENYGYVIFVLGELNYGDYTIKVSGDDLGRVRVQTQDIGVDGTPSFDPQR